MTAPALDRIAARYGRTPERRRRGRRIAVVAAVLGAIAVAVWALWSGFGGAAQTTTTLDTVAYHLHGDTSVSVAWQVGGDAGTRMDCAIEADAADHSIVGWKIVHLPPAGGRTRTGTTVVRTIQKPVTGLLSACWRA